jgi:ParB/RepB/Spo0J family partition protein
MNENEVIVRIELEKIVPHPDNRRVGGFDPAKLQQLAESIKAVGVLHPILVRKQGPCKSTPCSHMQGMECGVACCRVCTKACNSICKNAASSQVYELVAGERRWRAAALAGLTEIPACIRQLNDLDVLKIQTIENLQREDVHALDEADGYARLLDAAGYTIEQIAAELGKSASYVYQRLRLRDLIPEARKLFVENKITAGHAILIARLNEDQQREVIKTGLHRGYQGGDGTVSVRDLGEYIQERIFLNLSLATWPRDDAELVPAAGSCAACLKRSGAQPELFADVCTDTKKDYCLDRACFEKKMTAIIVRKRQELEGVKYFEAVGGWTGSLEKTPAGAVERYDWHECKKNDKGAQRVLVVAGAGKGKLTWGKKGREAQGYSAPKESAAVKEKRLEEERQRVMEREKQELVRRRIYEAVAKSVGTHGVKTLHTQGTLMHVLRFVAQEMIGACNNEELAKIEGWVPADYSGYVSAEKHIEPRLRKLDSENAILLFLLKLAMSQHLSEYDELKPLVALAEALGVDVKALTKAAATELRAEAAKAQDSAAVPSPKRGRKK